MKITVFSSNQPRHLNLVKSLAKVANEVFFVNEVNSVFPGSVADKIGKSEVKESYFSRVRSAERSLFGDLFFLPSNIRTLSIRAGDLSQLTRAQLDGALQSDVYIVFGASFIKGWLIDFLVERKAVNIHMGLSPFYRGAACNFWALYDNNPGYVGATIHYLSKGLDSGDMLFHCVPEINGDDSPFEFSMRAVSAAHHGLLACLEKNIIFDLEPLKQNRSQEIRYSRHRDFTDAVVNNYLARGADFDTTKINRPELLNPVIRRL